MSYLAELKDTHRNKKSRKRVGRGPGSGMGKTSCRGQKGQGARSGYKRRAGFEGGQSPLYSRMPHRGFSNARFRKALHSINLGLINRMFEDGETVSIFTLAEKGYLSGSSYGIKILAEGALTKKIVIEANAFSKTAEEKLKEAGISYTVV